MSRSVERRWEQALRYLQQGQIAAAHAQLESLRIQAPRDVRTRLLAARLAWHGDRVRDAIGLAQELCDAPPDDADLLCDTIELLSMVGHTAAAHRLLDHPVWQQTQSVDVLLRYANFRQNFGDHSQSLDALERLLSISPGTIEIQLYRGQELMFLGRIDEADTAFRTCLSMEPGNGLAMYRLARLRQNSPDKALLHLIDTGQRQTRGPSTAHAAFAFALYHVLEGLGRYDEAWVALAQANSEMHSMSGRDATRQQEGLQHFIEWLSANRPPEAVSESVKDGPTPIFIVGLPRSGTTLLERMLSNHSQVNSAGELIDFGLQMMRAAGTRSLHGERFLSHLSGLDLRDVARGYLSETAWRAQGRAFYVDKQPANWMIAGLIHLALPEARILHLQRDPIDVCFSNYRAMFGESYTWSYDCNTMAEHYRDYCRLMGHWRDTCPNAILDVRYADLISNPEAALRKVVAFCGLQWEVGCDDITRNDSPVSTLSSVQVREPVHTRALHQWRPYSVQLQLLQDALYAVARRQ
ncbi:MAG: sulfotransferase [Pseudomonadota bacterium]